jgi:long-chain acyl-CoA synthetase
MPQRTLDVESIFDGARIVILGGTGFLGKLFWAMLVERYPNVGRLYVVVRPKHAGTPESRFWEEIAPSESLQSLRRLHGDKYEQFLRDRVIPIDGDMGRPFCGLDPALMEELRGTIDVVVNVAGVVDFNPPLDEALDANAFGAQSLVELARALGQVPVLHTSTCYVAGTRPGPILEEDPRIRPFPRSDELGADLWDPDSEIAECLDLVAEARHRCADAFRQSEFAERARKNLVERGEPTRGEPVRAELARVKRKFVRERLVAAGLDRASHWGWPNIYLYTKAIGEQVIARSGLPFAIARPACCESCIEFPTPGFNEGNNTSAPLIYLMMKGELQILAGHVPLDLVPTDYVVAGMILAMGELIEGTAAPVYQFGASDINPCTAQRFGELVGLYKRKYYQRQPALLSSLWARLEPSFVTRERFEASGPPAIAAVTREVASFLRKAAPMLAPAADALDDLSKRESKVAEVQRLFEPFSAKINGPFDCSNTRRAYARLSDADKSKLVWAPESINWVDWMMNLHMPAMEQRIVPAIDRRLKKERRPLAAHATLGSLVDEMAERHDLALALQMSTAEGLTRVTFADVKSGADAVAARLAAAGVARGDRVAISARNQPDWAIAFFGIVRAGATAVPVDPLLEADGWVNILVESGARVVIWDESVRGRAAVEQELGGDRLTQLDMHLVVQPDPDVSPPTVALAPDDLASILFTSGTTGRPKGVMLTHANFTSLIAALAPLFPLSSGDAVVSVLPLHHTFEFTCGMLLPLSRGARVVYVSEIRGDRISEAFKASRAKAMVGVPALWQLLERRILDAADSRGPLARAAFDAALEVNRWLSGHTGVDLGRILFGSVHRELGGHVRWLVSGGAALPRETQERFAGLGLALSQGYGLTEAAPVLTVARPSRRVQAGVGEAVSGVELKIDRPDERGVGEIVARGPNVMLGYTDAAETREALDDGGWLHTGDLGRIDTRGALEIVGRLKDVVVSPTGENVYPDDVERKIGAVAHVAELAIAGIALRGGERLACLAVPEKDDGVDYAARMERAHAALRAALETLPIAQRPAIVHMQDAPLPRTATRKVKRDAVRAIVEGLVAAAPPDRGGDRPTAILAIVASIRGMSSAEVAADATLSGDLGFDSLMFNELHEALEQRFGAVDPERLRSCRSGAEIEGMLAARSEPSSTGEGARERAGDRRVALPPLVQEAGRAVIGKLQDFFYGEVMKPRVFGRANIPHNRNVIVVANHASHLDMGLVRFALGSYGDAIVSLAAQDYFFESGFKRAFFENLTNLKPIDRRASLRQSMRQASEVIDQGKTVLLFPEGTRSASGAMQEFKPLVGHLALSHGVDILPIHLAGTHAAMGKGAAIPTRRELVARIGPPLGAHDLARLTQGMNASRAARSVARIVQDAVEALGQGQVFDLAKQGGGDSPRAEREHPLVKLFAELEAKFRAGEVEKPVSYYVTLGSDELAKWTVRVDARACDVRPGKPDGGQADCVLKTSPEIFAKIVRESYVPSPADFLSGVVKSNDVALLLTFQKVFQLEQAS